MPQRHLREEKIWFLILALDGGEQSASGPSGYLLPGTGPTVTTAPAREQIPVIQSTIVIQLPCPLFKNSSSLNHIYFMSFTGLFHNTPVL